MRRLRMTILLALAGMAWKAIQPKLPALKAQLAKALNNGAASNNGAAPVSDPSPTVAPTVDAAAL
jgi:hypothetical protein